MKKEYMQVFSIEGETMLEVLFSDSEKGLIKAAKKYNIKNMPGEVVGYIEKNQPKLNQRNILKKKQLGETTKILSI
jgi:adenylylsulfate kinase-like enzyme